MNERLDNDRKQAWSAYWRAGALHSLPSSYAGPLYGAEVEEFWKEALGGLMDGDRVLEVGSGNAALAQWIRNTFEGRGPLTLHCVDIAAVQPLPDSEVDRGIAIRMHEGVAAESLPFPDGHFSHVLAQYAIEYTDLSRSVPELARVGSERLRIAMIAHHKASSIVGIARTELEQACWLEDASGLYDSTEQLIPYMALAETPLGRQRLDGDSTYAALKERFNHAQRAIGERARVTTVRGLLLAVAGAAAEVLKVARLNTRDAARELLARARADLAHVRVRLEEVCNFALDDAGVQVLAKRFAEHGLDVQEHRPVHDGKALLGWALIFDRRA